MGYVTKVNVKVGQMFRLDNFFGKHQQHTDLQTKKHKWMLHPQATAAYNNA